VPLPHSAIAPDTKPVRPALSVGPVSPIRTQNPIPGIRGGGNIGALVDFACEYGWGLQALGKCR
jgi:hypothetical protein